MDFIINNYLWFGIAGVVLLMALIGFLAEKTNFISGDMKDSTEKPLKEKKKRKAEQQEQTTEEIGNEVAEVPNPESDVVHDEVLDFSQITANSTEPKIDSAPLPVDDMWNPAPAVEETLKNEAVEQTTNPVITETGEDLSQPFGDAVAPQVSESTAPTNETDEDLWKF